MSDTYDDLLTETPDDSVATCSSSFPSTSDEDGSRPSSEDESETDAQKNVLLNSSVVVDAQDCSDNINYKAQTSYCCKFAYINLLYTYYMLHRNSRKRIKKKQKF